MARRLYLGRRVFFKVSCPFFAADLSRNPGLPPDARSDDVAKFFDGFGRIVDCRVMTGSFDKKSQQPHRLSKPSSGFGFVEFENSKVTILEFINNPLCPDSLQDAEDAVHNFNGKPFMGARCAA